MLLSTSEQADSGLGLEAQRAAITDEAKRRVAQIRDMTSGVQEELAWTELPTRLA